MIVPTYSSPYYPTPPPTSPPTRATVFIYASIHDASMKKRGVLDTNSRIVYRAVAWQSLCSVVFLGLLQMLHWHLQNNRRQANI